VIKQDPIFIQVTRGEKIESEHLVDAVVMDSQGVRLESFGEHNRPVFPRSAIKKIQAIALVESGAYEALGLTSQHLALACASHWATDEQVEILKDWMGRLNITNEDLVCGAHWPGDETAMHRLIRQNEQPTSLHNNCSGKHLGLITVAKHLGADIKSYAAWDHPVQVMLRKIFSDLSKYDIQEAPWGTDGCGIPSYCIALKEIAFAMSAFLGGRPLSQKRWDSCLEILAAVREHPTLIAGPKTADAKVIELSDGDVIIKTGAEGVYTALVFDKGLSIVVKCRDGATRGARAGLYFMLERYQIFNTPARRERKDELYGALREQLLPNIKNWAGQEVGKIQYEEVSY
jgi:L-asparaginase II